MVTRTEPHAVAIGDVDGDGFNDVVAVTGGFFHEVPFDNSVYVFRQLPDGTLAAPAIYPSGADSPFLQTPRSVTVAIGDVDGDGRNDVVVGNSGGVWSEQNIAVLYQRTDGTLRLPFKQFTRDSGLVRVADLNGDGRNDIVGVGSDTNTVSVFLQQPDGTLAPPVVYPVPPQYAVDLEVADVNHDGLTDVIVLGLDVPSVSVLYQQPYGTLGGLATLSVVGGDGSKGMGVGDVDGDGRNDVIVSYGWNPPFNIAIFRQQADGTLPTTPSAFLPSTFRGGAVEAADVDGDTRDDVVVVHSNELGTYLQAPDGTLAPEQFDPIPGGAPFQGLAVGDINRDGAPDIASVGDGVVILRHIAPPALPTRFYTLTPCRILDTPTLGRPLLANTYRTFTAVRRCGIPADARALAINVTAVNPGDLGNLRLYPAGNPMPRSSALNFQARRTRANNAIIAVGRGGEITIRNDMPASPTSSVHVIIDAYGFFR